MKLNVIWTSIVFDIPPQGTPRISAYTLYF